MKRYFLGMAENYSREKRVLKHTFLIGREKDRGELSRFLAKKYGGRAIPTKNGRSGLAMALMAYLEPGTKVAVLGFTCFAVFEAVKAAGMEPVFVNIDLATLNFDLAALRRAKKEGAKAVIVQNTLGNPEKIAEIEKMGLVIIEDLAHSAGIFYELEASLASSAKSAKSEALNGDSKASRGDSGASEITAKTGVRAKKQEAGTVGVATVLSFGKDKMVDTISGGAVVLREEPKFEIPEPIRRPRVSDNLRARFYPLFGAICRGLMKIRLGGALMRGLVKIHWVEKSADNRLDLKRKIGKAEAREALLEFRKLKGEKLRDFYLVRERKKVLQKLREAGYYFDGFWYEKPVSPARYFKKVHFPEENCPKARFLSEHIINFPRFYSEKELQKAREIIEPYLMTEAEISEAEKEAKNPGNSAKVGVGASDGSKKVIEKSAKVGAKKDEKKAGENE